MYKTAINMRKARQQGALDRLKAQLQSGTKTAKGSNERIPLTDKDKKRINKEIAILEGRI